ncbi:hypothetical protein JCM33374_g6480 [Metschnikowia sp. JCM 33374]|nr:hypothetical protein JCM33374_g6480 [Metschnikowia sp. JCM 33374]
MNIRSKLSSLREYLTPINHESNFRKTGEISPEEFVLAGDYLVSKFPTWTWGSGPKHLHKKFLPAEKQFLVTRHVPSYKRYASFLPETTAEDEVHDGSGAGFDGPESADSDVEWIPSFGVGTSGKASEAVQPQDLDDLIEEDAEDDFLHDDAEDFTHIESSDPGLRRYDLYIAYSTSYRVPKMYLVGFSGNGIPLLPPQMYEDISGDHKDKTATIEALPMSHNTMAVSIHPCKHSSVMKVFMEHARAKKAVSSGTSGGSNNVQSLTTNMDGLDLQASGQNNTPRTNESGATDDATSDDNGIRVDQYLVIFLKFIASVTPGIEYDFTMDAL